MTPQEVIKNFMAGLVESTASGKSKLDAAVKASSNFSSIQEVIDSMTADQTAAEKEAVEEVLGDSYAGKTISQVGSTILNKKATAYNDVYKKSNLYIGDSYSYSKYTTTVKDVINERKASIFLEKYCGIQLNKNYWYSGAWATWGGDNGLSGNVDTGAITGSDANISLKAGDVVGDTILTSALINSLAQKAGNSLSGDTLIIGTGTEKTERSIVPEIGNKYIATTSKAQNIQTGSNDWIVAATSYNDTITTGGADSISAGAGNDSISVGADYASILTGAGNDTVEISANVNNVTIGDLDSSDLLTISGTFNIGSAQIEDTMLVVTDKTGTRKIRLGNLDNAKNAKVNGSTLANWLSAAGFNINNLKSVSSSNVIEAPTTEAIPITKDGGRIDVDKDYKPTPIKSDVTESKSVATRSANTSGNVNVNLDTVTLSSGDLEIDGATVGEISNEFPNVSSFTKNGLTINLLGVTSDTSGDTSKIQSKTLNELTADQKTIVAGLFKWWAKECLKLNEESYGISFNSSTAMVKEIGLYFYDSKGNGNTLAAVWNWNSGSKTTQLMLNVNMNYYGGIDSDNFDGESSGTSALLDRTLAHEFTHAVMATNISYFNSLPQFIKEGMAELTQGIDDERGSSIFALAADSSKLSTALSLSNTDTGTAEAYSGGYMLMRYFARQAALQTLLDDVDTSLIDDILKTGTAGADSINNTLDGATINALGGNDTVNNTGATVSISGGAGNDYIINDGFNVTIYGGAGNDSISLSSDSTDNLIQYTKGDGNDIIYGFNENSTLSISGGNFSTTKSGSNIIVTVGSGKITLSGAATLSTVNVLDENSGEKWELKSTTATLKIDGKTVATVKGLKSGLTANDGAIDGITIDNGKIILSKKVIDTSNVTLTTTTGYDYKLAFDDDLSDSLVTTSNKGWTVSNGTAIFKCDLSAGYSIFEDGKTITYSKSATKAKELARVTGLAKTGISAADFSTSDNVITLKKSMVATSKIAIRGDGYTLALAEDVPTPELQNAYWTFSGTNATYKQDTSAGFTLATDNKSADYSNAKTESLAIVSGLQRNLTSSDGISVTGNVITLDEKVLSASNVIVKGDYTLAVADSLKTPAIKNRWLVNGTTATFDSVQSEYFTPSTDNKRLTYNKEKTTKNLITVKGLIKGAKVDDSGNVTGISLSDSTLTISGNELFGNRVEVKADDYTLNNLLKTPAVNKTYWEIKNGTATLKQDMTDGYALTTNTRTGVKTLTYTKAKTDNVAVVSGLQKNLTSSDGLSVTGNVITLDEKALGASNVTVKGNYTLAVADSLKTPTTKNRWLVNGTTATFDSVQSEYFTPSTDNKRLTYNKEKTTKNLVTVKGLVKGAKVDDSGNVAGISLSGSTLTISGDELFSNRVEVKADNYMLNNLLKTPAINRTYWTVKNGTATLKQDMTDGYALTTNTRTGVKTLTYTRAQTLNVATVSGLDKTLKDTNGTLDGLTFDINTKTITADSRVLTTSNISVKGDYTLDFVTAGSYSPPTATVIDDVWSVSGTTATYKNVNIGYFTRKDSKTFTYTKEKAIATLATVSGVKKNTSADNFSVNGNVITIEPDALVDSPNANTKIALGRNDSYTLDLDNDIPTVDYNDADWNYSSGKATLQASVKTAGYAISDDSKTITYIPSNAKKTYATISGVKSKNGISVNDNVISLTDAALNNKTVSLAKNDDYKLALGTDSLAPTPVTDETWKKSGTNVTLSVTMSKGYSPSADEKSLVYSNKNTNKTLATISGINSKADISTFTATTDGDSKKITLSNSQLSKKVTVGSDYNLEFANDYSNATIIGSANADKIDVAGSSLTVSGGRGDDKITFSGNGNTFLYASGDGNDVIADFAASRDKIKITSGKVSVESDGADVGITVDAGSIKLEGAAGQTISILDNKNKTTTYTTAATSNYWFANENSVASSPLSSIVKSSAQLPDDLNLNSATSLTNQKNQITYSSKK